MTQKKYGKIGHALTVRLTRLKDPKIKYPGKVSRLLLDTFIHNNGNLKAGQVVGLGLCEEGGFKIWRDKLVKSGFLQPWSHRDYSKHHCGPKLIKYINDAKILLSEIASRSELEALELAGKKELEALEVATKGEVEKLRKELREETAALRKMIEIHIQATNPPVNDEKVESCLKIVKTDESASSGDDLNEMFPVNIQ